MPRSPSQLVDADAGRRPPARPAASSSVSSSISRSSRARFSRSAAVGVVAVVVAAATGSAGWSSGRARRRRRPGRSPARSDRATACAVPAPQVGDVGERHPPRLHRVGRRGPAGAPGPSAARRPYRFGRDHARCARARSRPASRARARASTSRAWAGMSASSQSRPSTYGVTSVEWVDLDLLGAHDRPAALRLDPAHRGVRRRGRGQPMPLQCGTWKKRLRAVTGPIWHRLEQDVEAGFSHAHSADPASAAAGTLLARVDERDGGGARRSACRARTRLRSRCPGSASSIGTHT